MKENVYDFDSLSINELTAIMAEVESVRAKKINDAKVNFLTEMKERAAILGINMEDLLRTNYSTPPVKSRRLRKDIGTPHAVKYRGPAGEEWSGRGRPPRWISALEESGRKREEFLV